MRKKIIVVNVLIIIMFLAISVSPVVGTMSFSSDSVIIEDTDYLISGPYEYTVFAWVKGYEEKECGDISSRTIFGFGIIYKVYVFNLPHIYIMGPNLAFQIICEDIKINRPSIIGERFIKASGSDLYMYP